MTRKRLTITLKEDLLRKIDTLIDSVQIRSRSHAIEYLLSKTLTPKISQAVILAGGQGVRMRPFTYEIPKALIPVSGRPLIEHTLNLVKESGIRDIILAVDHLGRKIEKEIGDGNRFGVNITYSREKQPIGTARAILKARNLLKNRPFLVINGDVLTEINLSEFLDFHDEEKYVATMAVCSKEKTKGFGIVFLRGERVVKFLKRTPTKGLTTQLINAGFYILNQEIFHYIPLKGKIHLRDIFPKLAQEGKLAGFAFEGPWFDISTPQSYEEAIKTVIRVGR